MNYKGALGIAAALLIGIAIGHITAPQNPSNTEAVAHTRFQIYQGQWFATDGGRTDGVFRLDTQTGDTYFYVGSTRYPGMWLKVSVHQDGIEAPK